MRSADFGPTPLIFFRVLRSPPEIAAQSDVIFMQLMMLSAVLAPMPLTVISSSKADCS